MECRDLYFMFKYLNGSFDVDLKDFVKIIIGRTRNFTDTLEFIDIGPHYLGTLILIVL